MAIQKKGKASSVVKTVSTRAFTVLGRHLHRQKHGGHPGSADTTSPTRKERPRPPVQSPGGSATGAKRTETARSGSRQLPAPARRPEKCARHSRASTIPGR